MSRRYNVSYTYKIVFLVRFFGYLLLFSGLFGVIFVFGPFLKAEIEYRTDKILRVKKATDLMGVPNIVPVSRSYGIIIEKINANAKIIPRVNMGNRRDYTKALKLGVVEALGSTPPGQSGNLYLFSHSTDAPWHITRYNAIFYLLRELESGDRVIIFHQNKRFDYIVFDKIVTDANDISYFTNTYSMPILTLQTCDPPGTLLKRLVVRAKLVSS